MPDRYRGVVAAPEFPAGLEWVNTDRPLTLRDLRGKVVILDFWTYCCVNCLHVLPQLRRLEGRYRDALVVVGVHSAKHPEERSIENLRMAVQRHGVTHPVVSDADFAIWKAYGVKAWPSLVVINPEGKVVAVHIGEFAFEPLAQYLQALINAFDSVGEIDRTPLASGRHGLPSQPSELLFPSKVAADPRTRRLVISDTGHHQVRVCSPDGQTLTVCGSGEPGLADGPLDRCRLNQPQGVAIRGNHVFVADTENHALRLLDLEAGTACTLAGTGAQARTQPKPGPARGSELNSPWDVAISDSSLLVAMAGSHQLWRVDLMADEICPLAGSGREGLEDGPAQTASLAQPSALALNGSQLYFADSETSSVRRLDMAGDRVTTLVGKGLFEFGDHDGPAPDAKLQHPLGICVHEGAVYVADTFNSKIRRIDLQTKMVTTTAGTGSAGRAVGEPHESQFWEPGGIASDGVRMYVADTNNHRVCILDPQLHSVSELRLRCL